MAIDIIARGLATSLIGSDGKISSDKMPTLSAAPSGTTFYPVGALTDPTMLEGKTAEEIILMMLYGIVNPAFTNPSITIALDSIDVVIVGKPTTISGSIIFDRGAIAPPYGTSGYRAGAAIGYELNGVSLESTSFNLELVPVAGDNVITAKVFFAEGEQPFNSIGQLYDAPYPAGSLLISTIIRGINQVYSSEGTPMEQFVWFEDENEEGKGYQGMLETETATIKQSFAIVSTVNVIGFKQYEPMTQTWQWIGGSAEASLTYFDTTIIEGDSLGEEDDYVLYTNNDYLTGERELRIYVE